MKNIFLLLLSNLFLAVFLASCQIPESDSAQVIYYDDIIWNLSFKADLSSMTFTRVALTDDFKFCPRNSDFKCILRNDTAWVAIPRNLDFMNAKEWDYGGFKFRSMPIRQMFKCENGESQKWVKVKQFIGGDVQVFVLNDSGELKAFGTENPQNDFKEKAIGNVSEGDVLGYESLFIAVDGCGIKMP